MSNNYEEIVSLTELMESNDPCEHTSLASHLSWLIHNHGKAKEAWKIIEQEHQIAESTCRPQSGDNVATGGDEG